jgi:competence factor transport accessory protein ComB
MFEKKLLESAELYQKRYKNFATLTVLPVFVLVLFLAAFIFFAKKELTVTGVGTIQPIKVIAQIQSTSNSPIIQTNLIEGKSVRENELLVKYNGTSNTIQLDALKTQLATQKQQKQALGLLESSISSGSSAFSAADSFGYYQQYQSYLAQIQTTTDGIAKANQSVDDQNATVANEQTALTQQLATLKQQIRDYQTLQSAVTSDGTVDASNPFVAQFNSYQSQVTAQPTEKATLKSSFLATLQSNITQLQSQEDSLTTQSAGLGKSNAYDTSLSAQLLTLKAQELQKVNQEGVSLDATISDLNAKIALQKQADTEGAVYTPSAGILHVLPGVLGLKTIGAGTQIAEIYPALTKDTKVTLVTYVSSSEISGVKLGQTLRLSVRQNVPRPLMLSGKIVHIDSAPTTVNQVNVFAVKAEVSLSKADLPKIRYGLQGNIVIVTGEKTYFEYYKDKMMGENEN